MIVNGLLFGLISTLHCAGMCGPLAMMLPGNVRSNRVLYASAYQLGRIGVYISIGLLVFSIGMSFSMFRMQQGLSVALGAIMVVFALMSLFKIQGPSFIRTSFSKFSGVYSKLIAKGNLLSAFGLGMLNGLLPCGAIYVAAMYCATFTNALDASAYMFLFGIGTMPVFVAAWMMASKKFSLKLKPLSYAYRLLPLIVGILMVLRGINLGIPYISPEMSQVDQKTEIKNCCKH